MVKPLAAVLSFRVKDKVWEKEHLNPARAVALGRGTTATAKPKEGNRGRNTLFSFFLHFLISC